MGQSHGVVSSAWSPYMAAMKWTKTTVILTWLGLILLAGLLWRP